MAVRSILAKTDVSNYEERGKMGSKEPDCLNHRALGVVGCSTKSVLGSVSDGYTEENYGSKSFVDKRGEVWNKSVDAATVLIG